MERSAWPTSEALVLLVLPGQVLQAVVDYQPQVPEPQALVLQALVLHL